jgi:Tol biopolymer transport system component/aminoglycoside phosphotransferase (APT) family kinase protein
MGEVCRARDTKLNRDVALKFLPAAFVTDPERLTRFQREAQLLAALNHPNIAAIYGLEDEGSVRAIVMELVDGQTLTGPLPVADALPIAKQIAEALEYAHDRGIIHRDLKPANIKLTREGTVKVLDFGLAKAMDEAVDVPLSFQNSMSPTLSLAATHAGVILGTAAYMAPEQAKGKPADRRSDIWAFGVVLYELLTGHRMFGGDSVPETLASVMKDPIAFGRLPPDTPSPVRALVARCLEREPRRRLQSIGEARILIEDTLAGAGSPQDEESRAQRLPSRPSMWAWGLAAIGLLVAAGVLAWAWSRPAPSAPALARFTFGLPEGVTFTNVGPNAPHVAVSPDGRYVAFVVDQIGRDRTVWVRPIDSLVAQRLDRTEGASFPFWSPDSQHVAYFAGGKLMRIALAGGAPITICDAPTGEGGAWTQSPDGDGVIVFAPSATGPLSRVLARGGMPTVITTLANGEQGHSFPHFLPDGRRFLYWTRGGQSGIYVQSLDSSDRTFVVAAQGRSMYSPPGFLLYMRENTLLAHRWNLDTLALEGEPFTIAEDVRTGGGNGRNAFSVSAGGLLAYRGGSGTFVVRRYARDGKVLGTVLTADDFGGIAVSPDGARMAITRGAGTERDVWMVDLTSGVFSRVTSAAGQEVDPVWSPDSRRIAYVHIQDAKRSWHQTVIGSGTHREIAGDPDQVGLEDWTPDSQRLVLRGIPGTLSLVPAPSEDGSRREDGTPQVVLREQYALDHVRVSPDGKWVAYTSAESGRPQVVIASFPAFGARRQITTDAGMQPVWRADGKELFFMAVDQKLMAVDVDAGATLGPIKTLFQTAGATSTAVHMFAPDLTGQRFLVREPESISTAEQMYVVTNWLSLVR